MVIEFLCAHGIGYREPFLTVHATTGHYRGISEAHMSILRFSTPPLLSSSWAAVGHSCHCGSRSLPLWEGHGVRRMFCGEHRCTLASRLRAILHGHSRPLPL